MLTFFLTFGLQPLHNFPQKVQLQFWVNIRSLRCISHAPAFKARCRTPNLRPPRAGTQKPTSCLKSRAPESELNGCSAVARGLLA
jgi:hypothetical protein